jgi:F-type H+-transporting ATPase subunit a
MGEHDTWYTLLPFWSELQESFRQGLERDWQWMMFQATEFSLVHVAASLIAVLIILMAVVRWRASVQDESRGVIPVEGWGLPAMLDGFVSATYGMAEDIMGEDNARRYLPFVGTLALFIFCHNIQGLVPGFMPGTDTLKTNLALSLLVFVVYNAIGIKEQGFGYVMHFMGPSFELGGIKLPWLAPLMLPIELASHIARPVSLSLRLLGNILADHKVVGAILMLVPMLIPVPFLLLGVLVAIVQTVVFTLLTMIYIGEAAHHAEEH